MCHLVGKRSIIILIFVSQVWRLHALRYGCTVAAPSALPCGAYRVASWATRTGRHVHAGDLKTYMHLFIHRYVYIYVYSHICRHAHSFVYVYQLPLPAHTELLFGLQRRLPESIYPYVYPSIPLYIRIYI